MSSIKNLDQLRERVLDVFDELDSGESDVQKAGIIAKLSETVISGLKTQIEYARLTNEEPSIPFLSDCASVKTISNNIKLIQNKKEK